MYGGLIKKSWKVIFHHLDLFLPDVFSVVLTFILALIALAMSGIHPGALTSLANSSPDPLTLFNFINDVFIPNSLKIFLGVVFFIVTTFFFGTSLLVTKYKMFKDLLQNKKKVSFFQSFIPANEHYYWRILGLKILVFLIFFFVFLILSLLALVFALASPLLAVILLLLLFLAGFIYLWLMLFFIFPIAVLDDASPGVALSKSFSYSTKHLQHAFLSLLVVVGLNIAMLIGIEIVRLPFKSFLIFNIILGAFLYIIPNLWRQYFIFSAYKKVK